MGCHVVVSEPSFRCHFSVKDLQTGNAGRRKIRQVKEKKDRVDMQSLVMSAIEIFANLRIARGIAALLSRPLQARLNGYA